MTKNNDLYFKVLKILKEKNLTQTKLAKELGITQSSLSKVLSGKYSTKISTAQKLAKVLDVPVNYFIDTDDNSNDNTKKDDKKYSELLSKIEFLEEKMKRFEAEIELLKIKKK